MNSTPDCHNSAPPARQLIVGGLPEHCTRLYLARHGELVTSHEWRYVGHSDVELNATGIASIRRLGRRLQQERIDVVIASDLKRAAYSAEIIADIINVRLLCPQPAFREIKLGHWEGLTMQEIAARYPDEFARRTADIAGFRVQGGESFQDVRERALPRLKALLEENSGMSILLVAHGGTNRVMLCSALGMPLVNLIRLEQSYACLNIIDYFEEGPVVRLINGINGAE